jgi:hypothetical protein
VFAYRRKIAKELGYDERSKPMIRRTEGEEAEDAGRLVPMLR